MFYLKNVPEPKRFLIKSIPLAEIAYNVLSDFRNLFPDGLCYFICRHLAEGKVSTPGTNSRLEFDKRVSVMTTVITVQDRSVNYVWKQKIRLTLQRFLYRQKKKQDQKHSSQKRCS